MANIYRQLDCQDRFTFCDGIRNALSEKFGDGVTIHNYDGDAIFTCPNLSHKVMKIWQWGASYGDAYTSGQNMSEEKAFHSTDSAHPYQVAHMVLGDNFLFITGKASNGCRANLIIAKTKGGKSIVHGSSSHSQVTGANLSIDITNGLKFEFVDICTTIMCNTNVPYKMPLWMTYTLAGGDSLLRSADGAIDTIEGLYMSTYGPYDNKDYVVTNKAMFSNRDVWNESTTYPKLWSSILAEF